MNYFLNDNINKRIPIAQYEISIRNKILYIYNICSQKRREEFVENFFFFFSIHFVYLCRRLIILYRAKLAHTHTHTLTREHIYTKNFSYLEEKKATLMMILDHDCINNK